MCMTSLLSTSSTMFLTPLTSNLLCDPLRSSQLTAYINSLPKNQQAPGTSPEQMAELMNRYNIEVVAPKKKKTQVLTEAPKSVTDLSAHSCIAEFESISGLAGSRIATFKIVQYLRYAHLFPALASGLVTKFDLKLDEVDRQTSILASKVTETSLAQYIVDDVFTGDRLELEWRQIRCETETPVEEDKFIIIEQVVKLAKLDGNTEAALLKQWPEPQIMIRKPQGAEGATCS